ncbi:phage tail protein [Hymenobacter sp. GOD-10R]|uniref:phage tail protein n=1 Tax=Hymenobacter sp. GOD-10R TaxID=3093922 RepID=UPI002D791D7A|nr:tail fiber protein [Hymenobacter sp. GOD-10R]WRQ30683.1 tail fiber protein [Hymenobacter sp. GOD-10R]
MDDPYLGEIRPIAINYEPKGWAFCAGQLLSINQNAALFTLIGTTYGGNGTTTFALPDLRGRVVVGAGQLASGSNYLQGQLGGAEQVSLTRGQLPAHNHNFSATLQTATEAERPTASAGLPGPGVAALYTDGPANAPMGTALPPATSNAGGSLGHENRQPYVALNYVIALTGVFPSFQ